MRVRSPILVFCAAAFLAALGGVSLNAELVQEENNESLFAAIQARDPAACEAALRAGADPNATTKNPSALDAPEPTMWQRLRRLFAPRRAITAEEASLRKTALGAALWDTYDSRLPPDPSARSMVAVLLRQGADPNGVTHYSRPLCLAAQLTDTKMAQRLIDAGAHINETTPNDRAPLSAAALNDDAHMVSFLLARGANPNWRSAEGMTALHNAVTHPYSGRSATVRNLLAGGADARIRDKRGDTALAVALRTVASTALPFPCLPPPESESRRRKREQLERERQAREQEDDRAAIAILQQATNAPPSPTRPALAIAP